MVKRRVCSFLLLILLLLCGCSNEGVSDEESTQPDIAQTTENRLEIKAMWLTCYELNSMLTQGDSQTFSSGFAQVLDVCRENSINTLFVHVRPFCDSFYPSDYYPWSEYALSSSGEVPSFDPLEIMVSMAHESSVSIHAWINPYRVSYDSEDEIPEEISGFAFSCDKGIYLKPSDVLSQRLVLDGIREIMLNYNVDGIHIDDYFYPETNEPFDKEEYDYYFVKGGELSKSSWRRESVNALVSAAYSLVHSIDDEAVFSISPCADISKNKKTYYADVELWCSSSGYADWIIPQIYFGFEHWTMPFERVAEKWKKLTEGSEIRLICGLAPYKQGKADSAAGTGKNEWKENENIIDDQIHSLKKLGYDGYALFSYSYVTGG